MMTVEETSVETAVEANERVTLSSKWLFPCEYTSLIHYNMYKPSLIIDSATSIESSRHVTCDKGKNEERDLHCYLCC